MGAPAPSHRGALATPARARVAVVIPTLNEEEPIGDVIRPIPDGVVDEVIVADSASGGAPIDAPGATSS